MATITTKEAILLGLVRACAAGLSDEDAIEQVARENALPVEAVREVVEDAQNLEPQEA
jgi:Flp pilus assembly protein TadB